uniref:Uncharacterized protein n=1 Tax=Romanomermis culicivorax TaxID=13658 RepID=A0A915KQS7_ROMCU
MELKSFKNVVFLDRVGVLGIGAGNGFQDSSLMHALSPPILPLAVHCGLLTPDLAIAFSPARLDDLSSHGLAIKDFNNKDAKSDQNVIRSKRVASKEIEKRHSKPWMVCLWALSSIQQTYSRNHSVATTFPPSTIQLNEAVKFSQFAQPLNISSFNPNQAKLTVHAGRVQDASGTRPEREWQNNSQGDSGSPIVCQKEGQYFAQGVNSGLNHEETQ